MAKPNIAILDAAIYTRLSGDLVSTYAKAVYAGYVPPGNIPTASDKPVVSFYTSLTRDPTFGGDDAVVSVEVYIIAHAEATHADAVTAIGRVLGDGSTYGLHRWVPTVSGLGTNPLVEIDEARGLWDDTHIAYVLRFETYAAEG